MKVIARVGVGLGVNFKSIFGIDRSDRYLFYLSIYVY